MQVTIEQKYSRKSLRGILSKEIKLYWLADMVLKIEDYRSKTYSYESKNIRISKLPESMLLAEQIAIAVLKAKGELTTIQAICSSIATKIDDDLIPAITSAAEILAICDDGPLYELMAHNYPSNYLGTLALEPKVKPSEETLILLDQLMYMPPNLEQPKWVSNSCGGLQAFNDHVILGKNNKHNEYQALNVLNILQSIKWELDPTMLSYREEPNKRLDTPEKIKQFALLRRTSRQIYNMYKNKTFYFIWKFDKRGRSYSCGYQINLQSTDYKKSLLNFAQKVYIS